MFSLIEKLGFVALLFFGSCGLVSAQNPKPLDAFFDPAVNETTVYLSPKYVPLTIYPQEGFIPPDSGMYVVKPESLVLTVFFKTPGNRPAVPAAVTLTFESRGSGDFRYERDRQLIVKADGETLDLGELKVVKSERDISSRGMRAPYYEETLETTVKLEVYSGIVRAKRVEINVGKTKIRISEKKLEDLRSYVDRLKS